MTYEFRRDPSDGNRLKVWDREKEMFLRPGTLQVSDNPPAEERPCWNCGTTPAVKCCEFGRDRI